MASSGTITYSPVRHAECARRVRNVACIVLIICFACFVPAVDGQSFWSGVDLSHPTVTGSATFSGDFYHMGTDGGLVLAARQPLTQLRLFAMPTITAGDLVVPISIAFTSWQTNWFTPYAPGQSFSQYIQNPMNTLGASPHIKWARLNLGSFTPELSELTAGNAQIFGAGVDLSPETYHAMLFTGTMQRSISSQLSPFIAGAYGRSLTGMQLGYTFSNKATVALNLVHAADDTTSVTSPPYGAPPQEAVDLSLSGTYPVSEHLSAKAEVAASAATHNMRSDESSTVSVGILAPFITARTSSRSDYAWNVAANYTGATWGMNGKIRYVGDGYVPAGYLFTQSDIFEVAVAPHAQLFNNIVYAAATIGYRTDNLAGTKAATTSQILASLMATANLSADWSLAFNATNFGIRNDASSDTLKIQTVSRTVSITPSYRFSAFNIRHTASLTLGLDTYTDDNTVTGVRASNDTRIILLNDGMIFGASPMTGSVYINVISNNLPGAELSTTAVGLSAAYALVQYKLWPGASLAYTSSSTGPATANGQIIVKLSCRAELPSRLTLNVSSSWNLFTYGSALPGASFAENIVRTSLSRSF